MLQFRNLTPAEQEMFGGGEHGQDLFPGVPAQFAELKVDGKPAVVVVRRTSTPCGTQVDFEIYDQESSEQIAQCCASAVFALRPEMTEEEIAALDQR